MNPTGLYLKKPVSVYRKKLRLNFGMAFKSSIKILIDVSGMNLSSASKEAVELIDAFGLAETEEEKAYLLIHISLVRSMQDLTRKLANETSWKLNAEIWEIHQQKLDEWMDKERIEIFDDFFKSPTKLILLRKFQQYLKSWLKDLNVPDPEKYCKDIPFSFKKHLFQEWKKNKAEYEIIEEHFKNPFIKSFEIEHSQKWINLSYDLNNANRSFEIYSLNDHLEIAKERKQTFHFIFLIADLEAEVESFVDRWIAEQESYDLRAINAKWKEKDDGFNKGIFPLRWENHPKNILEIIESGINEPRGYDTYVALIEISPSIISFFPIESLLPHLNSIEELCCNAKCEVLLFVFIHQKSISDEWVKKLELMFKNSLFLQNWSFLDIDDIINWFRGKTINPKDEKEFIERCFPNNISSISMRHFRGYAYEFLKDRYKYQ